MSLPWSVMTLPALWKSARDFRTSALRTFIAIGFGSALLALSLSASKVVEYLLPLYFFLGLAAAEWVQREFHHEQRRGTFFFGHVYSLGALFTVVPAVLFVHRPEPRALAATLVALLLFVACLYLPRTRERFWLALALVVLSEGVALGALDRELDRHKTSEPFFALIRPALAGREVVTSLRDDTLLPLVNFGLGRRVTVLADKGAVVAALSGPKLVAAIVPAGFEKGLGTFPRGLRLARLQSSTGKRRLVCFLNDLPLREGRQDP